MSWQYALLFLRWDRPTSCPQQHRHALREAEGRQEVPLLAGAKSEDTKTRSVALPPVLGGLAFEQWSTFHDNALRK